MRLFLKLIFAFFIFAEGVHAKPLDQFRFKFYFLRFKQLCLCPVYCSELFLHTW